MPCAMQVAGNLVHQIRQFKVLCPPRGYGSIAHQRTKDVARNGAGGIAVSGVVDRSAQAGVKVVTIAQGGVHGNGKGLFPHPSFTQHGDVHVIGEGVLCQLASLDKQPDLALHILGEVRKAIREHRGYIR